MENKTEEKTMKDEKKILKDEELKQVSGGFDQTDEQILTSVGIYPKDQHLMGQGKDPKEAQRSENG